MTSNKDEIPKFGEMSYWEEGYKTGSAPREWFLPFTTIKEFIEKHCPKESKSLVIGCGTSSLSNDMFETGYKDLESMDYSPEAISQMKNMYPHLKWTVGDVREMEYSTGTFDTIIDKGTLDCLFFLDETNEMILQMLSEVYRVLKPEGRYCVVTCGCPMQRNELFHTKKEWKWNVLDWEEYEPPEGEWTHPFAYIYYIQKYL